MTNTLTPSAPVRSIALAAALKRMHRAQIGACRCGACAHQLRVTELRFGLHEGSLREALAVYDPPKRTEARGRGQRRRPLTAQVAQSARIVHGERVLSLAEAAERLGSGGHPRVTPSGKRRRGR